METGEQELRQLLEQEQARNAQLTAYIRRVNSEHSEIESLTQELRQRDADFLAERNARELLSHQIAELKAQLSRNQIHDTQTNTQEQTHT